MTDERLNVPSASAMERIALCPGSRAMEARMPETRSDDSDEGISAHDIAAAYFHKVGQTGEWHPFVAEDYLGTGKINAADVVASFVQLAKEVFDRWYQAIQQPGELNLNVEQRIVWLDDSLNPVMTGQPDVLFIAGNDALVLDLKSLYGQHAESASNLQLRSYAVLTVMEHGVANVTVAIIQPRVSREPQVCLYDRIAIRDAERELALILDTAKDENLPADPLIAGEKQCRHCRAKDVCPAARRFAMLEDRGALVPVVKLAHGQAQQIAASVSIQELEVIYRRAGTVRKILDAVEERLKSLPADQLATVGLELAVSRGDRMITSAQDAFPCVSDALSIADYNGCCTVGITKLLDAYRKATKKTVKETNADMEKRLGALLSRKPDTKTLRYAKPGASQPVLELES